MVFSLWYLWEGYQFHLDKTTTFTMSALILIVGVTFVVVSSCGLVGVLIENSFLSKFVT